MKKIIIATLLAACMLSATACGGKSEITTGNKKLANAAYNDESISLAPYTGLNAEKKVYQVTAKDVENAIQERLAEFAEYESVKRASKDGDWVYVDITAKIDGDTVMNEKNYDFTLGDEEYGPAFDQKLTGVSIGDDLSFSLDFEKDFFNADWAGKTVAFEIKVCDVREETLPEPTDKFVKEKLKCSSYDALEDQTRETLAKEYETESEDELREDLLKQVIDASSILRYTKKEYDEIHAQVEGSYLSYADMFGYGTNLDALFKTLDMTEKDMEDEVQEALYRSIVVNAIIKNESISLSDEDYEQGIARYMEQNGYDSREEFINDYGEEEIRRQLLEDSVLDFLVDHAGSITEVEATHNEE